MKRYVIASIVTGFIFLVSGSANILNAQTPCNTDNNCTIGSKMCQKSGSTNTNTGYICTCVDLSNISCPSVQSWSCGTVDTNSCPITSTGGTQQSTHCTTNTCSVSSSEFANGMYINHYRSLYKDDITVTDIIIKSGVQSATLGAVNCGAEQIDLFVPGQKDHTESISRIYPTDCAPTPQPSTPVPPACSSLYFCNTANYTCASTSSTYDQSTHIQCGGGATCEQNIQAYLPNNILPNAQCYSSLTNCTQACVRPPITAQCVSTRIYSPNWTQITPDEYFNLSTNNQTSVYFCVAGSSSAGAFDMARFTINGKLYPNTTVVRPNSSDFCQVYVLAKGVYETKVQGEIHHNTLGWL